MAKRITEEDLRVSITVGGNASGEMDKMSKTTALYRKTMSELRKEARLLQIQLDKVVPESDDWKRLSSELKTVKDRMTELRKASSGTASVLGGLKSKIAPIAAALAAVKKGAQALSGVFHTIADFEQANANLATVLGMSVKEMESLTKSALDLGRTTEYTAAQVTSLQTELAKLGFDEAQIKAMQKPVLQFATAIGADLSEAASLAGAALRMFGLRSEDTEDALGTLVLAADKSALGFEYFKGSLSTVGPVAATFGFSLKDTAALLGVLANSGFDASSAATATRNILLNLADSSGKLAQALGKPVRNFADLIEGLKTLNERGVDLNTTLELTDKRSVAAFNTFLAGTDSALELRDSLEDVSGELQRIADQRLDTVQGSIKLLQSAWEGFTLQFYESRGPIKQVIDLLTAGITKAQELLFSSARITAKAGKITEEINAARDSGGYEAAEKEIEEQLAAAEKKLSRTKKWLFNPSLWRVTKYFVRGANERLSAAQQAADEFRSSYSVSESDADFVGPAKPAGITAGTNSKPVVETPDDKAFKSKWSLSQDESYLAAKSQLAKRYAEGDIATQAEYDEMLYQLEISSLTARLALNKEKGKDRSDIEIRLQEKILAHKKKEAAAEQEMEALKIDAMEEGTAKRLAEEDLRYRQEQRKYQGNAEALETIERKHRNNILQISVEAEQEQLRLMQQESQREKLEIENRYLERLTKVKAGSQEEVSIRKEMAQEMAQADLKYLESTKKLLESLISTGQLAGVAIPDDKLAAFKKQLQEVVNQILNIQGTLANTDGGILAGTGKGELFGVGQAQWSQLFANLKSGKLSADDLSSSISAIGSAAQGGLEIASQAIDMINAKENAAAKEYRKDNEKKQEALEKRLDAGLITQEQYDAEITRLQEEQDQYDEELSLKQAERQKRFNLVQAIINTALGVTKTLADWGIPAGIAPAAIMAAMGAAQVALIASTPVTSGYAEGGYVTVKRQQDGRKFTAKLSPDRRGFVTSPTMLVGEEGGEYVIPSEGLKNPSVRSTVEAIEAARVAGRLSSLKLAAVNPAAAIGFASGGYTATSTSRGNSSEAQTASSNGALTEQLLRKLLDRLDTPISAEVSMLGPKGIVSATDKYNRQRNRGRR